MMTDKRFNQLLEGPLNHPLMPFRITRLALALRALVAELGEPAEQALERICAQREEQDRRNAEE